MAGKIVFLVVLLVGTCLSRTIQNKRLEEQRTRKYAVAYPQPVALQGVTNYGCGGGPCASHSSYQPSYASSAPTCCPSGGNSCCGSSLSPPCCLTIQPYESKNITVDAPSKVVLQINVLPVPANKTTPTTAPTSGSTAGSTPTGGSTVGPTQPPPPPPNQNISDLAGANNLQAFRAEALAESNKERAIHSANGLSDLPSNDIGSKLILDSDLNIAAQRYAQKIAAEKKPAHSDPVSRINQGENIAVACSAMDKPLSGRTAASMWYNEVKNYDFNMPGYSAKTGHFTQAIWKGSKRVGFGRSKYINEKGKSCYVVVARYTPRGNIKGRFPQNVLKGNYQQI